MCLGLSLTDNNVCWLQNWSYNHKIVWSVTFFPQQLSWRRYLWTSFFPKCLLAVSRATCPPVDHLRPRGTSATDSQEVQHGPTHLRAGNVPRCLRLVFYTVCNVLQAHQERTLAVQCRQLLRLPSPPLLLGIAAPRVSTPREGQKHPQLGQGNAVLLEL